MAEAVTHASALVDLLLGNDLARAVGQRLAGTGLHAPSHVDAEVLSAFGRLPRAGVLDEATVETKLTALAAAPIIRHGVDDLLLGAWARRHRLRLADAIYIELADRLGCAMVRTDCRLRDEPGADVVGWPTAPIGGIDHPARPAESLRPAGCSGAASRWPKSISFSCRCAADHRARKRSPVPPVRPSSAGPAMLRSARRPARRPSTARPVVMQRSVRTQRWGTAGVGGRRPGCRTSVRGPVHPRPAMPPRRGRRRGGR